MLPMYFVSGCLGQWTIDNLLNLNLSKCDLRDFRISESSDCAIYVKLTVFKNLRSLNLSQTLLTQRALQMICEDLKFLEKLDVSGTCVYDLSPLLLLENRLTSLSICVCNYNSNVIIRILIFFSFQDIRPRRTMTDVIIRLQNLRYLDISLLNEELQPQDCNFNDLLEKYHTLPQLVSLDVSGWRDRISKKTLLNYIAHHPNLRYVFLLIQAQYLVLIQLLQNVEVMIRFVLRK